MVLAFNATEKDGKMEIMTERQREPKIQLLACWKVVDFLKENKGNCMFDIGRVVLVQDAEVL